MNSIHLLSRRIFFLLSILGSILLNGEKANAAQLTLRWQDSSTNETVFQIQRRTGLQGTFTPIATLGANRTSYVDGSLAAGTTYCYRVRASNAAGSSPFSNEACGTATIPPPIMTPSDYDSDAMTDLVSWRPTDGRWYIRTSTSNSTAAFHRAWGREPMGICPCRGITTAMGLRTLQCGDPVQADGTSELPARISPLGGAERGGGEPMGICPCRGITMATGLLTLQCGDPVQADGTSELPARISLLGGAERGGGEPMGICPCRGIMMATGLLTLQCGDPVQADGTSELPARILPPSSVMIGAERA